jgi:hypothetical protein
MQTKHKKLIIGILLVFVAIMFLCAVPVLAETVSCPMCGNLHDLGEIKKGRFLFKWCSAVYGGSSLKELGLAGGLDTNLSGFFAAIGNVYDSIAVVGKILVLIHFSTDLYELYSDDKLTAETFFRSLSKLIIGILIIDVGFDLVLGFLSFSDWIYGKTMDGTAASLAQDYCNFEFLIQSDMVQRFGEMFTLVVPYALISMALITVQFFVYLRLMDIIVKMLFAPIGIADLSFAGTNGSGFRYLKKLAASALQGAVMVVVLLIQSKLTQGANLFQTLIIYYAMIGVFRKANSFASDVVGA